MCRQIGLTLLLLTCPLKTGAGEVEELLPIRLGASWTYSVSKDRVTTIDGRVVEERITGQTVEKVTRRSEDFSYRAPVYVLAQEIAEENQNNGRKRAFTLESHLSVEPAQVLMHGQFNRGAPGMEAKLTRFEPPVAVLKLPIPKPSEPFPSIMRSQGVTIDSRPYERADETVKTPAGEFSCVRISSRGSVSGTFPAPAPLRITTGSIEETSWFAKGVGIVKQVQVLTLSFELPNGLNAVSKETKVKELSKFAVPDSPSN
jgi:hypothetical protein